jgi:hypothetical protein
MKAVHYSVGRVECCQEKMSSTSLIPLPPPSTRKRTPSMMTRTVLIRSDAPVAAGAPPEKTRERVFRNLAIALAKDPALVVTPMDLLSILVQMIETFGGLRGPDKKALVIRTFEDIVSGHDGVLGTDADLLPPEVVQGMRVMLESNLITSIIDVVCAATVGRVISGISVTAHLSYALCQCARSCCVLLYPGCCCRASTAQQLDHTPALGHTVASDAAMGDDDGSLDALQAPLLQHIPIRPPGHQATPPQPAAISQAQQDQWVAACMTAPTLSALRRTQSFPRGSTSRPLPEGGAAYFCRRQSAQSI